MFNFVIAFSGPVGRALANLKRDERGIAALEYGILAGLAALAITAGVTTYGSSLTTMFNNLSGRVAVLVPA